MHENRARRVAVRLIEVGPGAFMVRMKREGDEPLTDAVLAPARATMRRCTSALRSDGYHPVGRWRRDELSLRREWVRDFAKGADMMSVIENMLAELELRELALP
jgi:hypothetical protein